MVRTFFSVLSIFISFVAFSQSDFQPGFVVNNQGDTLKGMVDFRNGSAAYEVCVFKKAETAAPVTYYPGDIKLYGFVDNKVMESRQIVVDKVEKLLFIEVVVRGTVTLYKMNEMFWVEKQGSGFHHLVNSVTGRHFENNKTTISMDNRHIGTLTMMMHDCPDVKRDIEKIELSKRRLTNLVDKYNKCAGDVKTVVYQSKKRWAVAKFGVVAGANTSRIKFDPSGDPNTTVKGPSQWETSMIIGPTMDLYFPRAGERLAFTTGLLYFGAVYDMHFQTRMMYSSKEWIVDDYLNSDVKQLQIPLGAKYTFPSKKSVQLYVNGGIMLVRNLMIKTSGKQEITYDGEVKVYDKAEFYYKSLQEGFWGGVGVIAPFSKKVAGVLELRADWTNGITPRDASSITSSVVNYKVVVGIRMN
ncbi:MAG: outer membrane beta-barrel protein [Chryseolinea sp.]